MRSSLGSTPAVNGPRPALLGAARDAMPQMLAPTTVPSSCRPEQRLRRMAACCLVDRMQACSGRCTRKAWLPQRVRDPAGAA